jgi:hypothetical protein
MTKEKMVPSVKTLQNKTKIITIRTRIIKAIIRAQHPGITGFVLGNDGLNRGLG